jgi:putative GTP pyrophosphokinase
LRDDQDSILLTYRSIYPILENVQTSLSEIVQEALSDCPNVDRICFRVKTEKSFIDKINALTKDNLLKYKYPFRELQDLVGGRVVVYYKSDIRKIEMELERNFKRVEKIEIVPDDEKEFGYEGIHYILVTPNHIYNPHRDNINVPYFFELQIKTLYQHAWAQSEHGLGYKPGIDLPKVIKRKLAFLAAQSWGADEILEELVKDVNELKKDGT